MCCRSRPSVLCVSVWLELSVVETSGSVCWVARNAAARVGELNAVLADELKGRSVHVFEAQQLEGGGVKGSGKGSVVTRRPAGCRSSGMSVRRWASCAEVPCLRVVSSESVVAQA